MRAHIVCFALLLTVAPSSAGEPTREDQEFFEKNIRPLLAENCFKCHTGPKLKGHLALDSRAALLKGGDTGPAVVPGAPEKSLLMKAIGYEDAELRMPPRGKLTSEQIAVITRWIKNGAHWPGDNGKLAVKKDFNLDARRGHWSLLPLQGHRPPAVKNSGWVRSPIDAFILAKLEQNGLTPAAPADRRTLLRRATFDLIGLPPTPEEISAFLNDSSPDAFAKVVDRMLASPHYGERWARHWLDLTRYAETYGHEFDFEIPDAWRCRDYAIRAFNEDVPYDRFVMENVAGDLLDKPRRNSADGTNESILGTGFWLLGEAKHSPVDTRSDQAERIDNQIDVFGKTFLGMTIACARCHDHKFDAISTRDYYALAGYLQSSRQQRAFIDDPAPRLEKIRSLRALQEKAARLAVEETVAYLNARKELPSAPLETWLGGMPSADKYQAARQAAITRLHGQQARADATLKGAIIFAGAGQQGFRNWLATGEAFTENPRSSSVALDLSTPRSAARILPPQLARSDSIMSDLAGALRSPTFVISKKRIHYRIGGQNARVNLILNGLQLIQDPIYGGLTFTVNTKPGAAYKGPAYSPPSASSTEWRTMDVSMWIGQRAYIEFLDEGPGHIQCDQVIFSDDGPPQDAPNSLVLALLENAQTPEQLTAEYQLLGEKSVQMWKSGQLDNQPDARQRTELLNAILAAATKSGEPGLHQKNQVAWSQLDKEYAAIRLPLPAPRRGLAMADGTPFNERVFVRGNPKILGDEVPRRFLEVFEKKQVPPVGQVSNLSSLPHDNSPPSGSNRLDLARQMTDPAQTPIVPRVIVNRLWKHHFVNGIVRSPDDFGVLGQPPTHPELLDYLAVEFVKNGWSIKKLHRLLLLSNTYQMDSKPSAAALEIDPDNKLLQRMPVRRLEAEAIRDALLTVSGRLDRSLYGPSVPIYLTPFMVGRGRPGVSGPLDGSGRRSIYLGIRRNFLNPMFLAFDFPTPFSSMGKRSVSNVPAQALAMMNNPLAQEEADLWAKKVLASPRQSSAERITSMYVAALGRPPSSAELAGAGAFLEEQLRAYGSGHEAWAWTDLGHVVFNLKEFVFVN